MCYLLLLGLFLTLQVVSEGQVLLIGSCKDVETVKYFELERFLGKWYQVARFPTWYEDGGDCSYKAVQQCGRQIAFQHSYVKNGIQYILHINSTYAPGDEAVFHIQANNIDTIGIPLSVVTTDYTNYAVVYGCKVNTALDFKYVIAWILSRNPSLEPSLLDNAYQIVNSLPSSNIVYLETVQQDESYCSHQWSAHIHAEYHNSTIDKI